MPESTETAMRRTGDIDRLSRLEATVEALGGYVESIKVQVGRIEDAVGRAQRTPWGTLGTWAVVVLTACSLIGGLVAYGLNNKVDAATAHLRTEIELRGEVRYWQGKYEDASRPGSSITRAP